MAFYLSCASAYVCQAPIHKRDLLFSRKTAIVLLYCMYLYIYSLHYSVCVVHIYPCYDYKTFLERWLYIWYPCGAIFWSSRGKQFINNEQRNSKSVLAPLVLNIYLILSDVFLNIKLHNVFCEGCVYGLRLKVQYKKL